MNDQTVSRIIRSIGVILIAVITLSFIWREVVFTGVYEVEQTAGHATRLAFAPWPKDRLKEPTREASGQEVLPIIGESIFFPVSLPRSFFTLTVTADLATAPPEDTELGIQIRPGVFWYLKHPATVRTQSDGRTQIQSTFDLRGIDQRQHLVNILLFVPGTSPTHALSLERIHFKFQRPSIIDSVRGRLHL